jgi:hypothetical protein
MSTYKPFITADVVVTPFQVNKSFTFTGPTEFTSSNAGIDRFIGKNIESTIWVSGSDVTGQVITYSQELVYHSIRQLYYSNYLRGEDGSPVMTASFNDDGTITGGAGTQNPSYYNYLPNTLDANRSFPTGSNDKIGVISVPSKIFGEYIKPGSFNFSTPNNAITDDGQGGLIKSNTKIGDIIYQHGLAIVTTSSLSELDEFITGSNVTCSFESTMTIYESQYKCTLLENEFNYSQNPSIISGSSNSGTPLDFVTGSYFEPYITTVGLYNNSKELLAIGKMAQPLQSSDVTDTTILVNLDR